MMCVIEIIVGEYYLVVFRCIFLIQELNFDCVNYYCNIVFQIFRFNVGDGEVVDDEFGEGIELGGFVYFWEGIE